MLPYTVDVPMRRWPIANWALIATTCAVSVWLLTLNDLPRWALNRPGEYSVKAMLGSVLAHADVVHLVGNMIFLFVFGNAINAKLGHAPFLVLYAGVAVLEGLFWAAAGAGPALGASGAIMGVVGVFLVFYPRNDITVLYWVGPVPGTFELSAYFVIAAYVAFDIWGLASSGSGGVAYLSHVVGFAVGAGGALALVASGLFPSEDDEENVLEATGLRAHPRETREG